MERRTLLGGGAGALAIGLAGCTGLLSNDETSDEPTNPGDDTDDDPDDETDPTDENSTDDEDSTDDEEQYQPIPGLDDLDIDEEGIDLSYAKHRGGEVEIGLTVEKRPDDVTRSDLERYAEALVHAVEEHLDEYEQFKSEVETLTVTIYDRWDEIVLQFFLDVEWLLAYVDGELDLDELVEKALDERE